MKSCSRQILELFYNAKHSGRVIKPEAVGRVGGDNDGLVIELTWRVISDVIVDAKFRAFGNPNAIAITSLMTDYIVNKPIDDAITIDETVIEQSLGELRPEYIEVFDMVKLAITDAYNNYLKRSKRADTTNKSEMKQLNAIDVIEENDESINLFTAQEYDGVEIQGVDDAQQIVAEIIGEVRGRGRPRKYPIDQAIETGEKRGRGRPRKAVEITDEEQVSEQRGRGRPRKYPVQAEVIGEKRGRGRPRKPVDENAVVEEKRGRGRPRKVVEVAEIEQVAEKRGRGRPRKIVETTNEEQVTEKRGRGRPRKVVVQSENEEVREKRGRGRPRKIVEVAETEQVTEKSGRGRPRKPVDENAVIEEKRGRGRPRKLSIETLQPMAPIVDDESVSLPNDFDKIDEVKSVDQLITSSTNTSYIDSIAEDEMDDFDIFKSNIRNILSGHKPQSYSTSKTTEQDNRRTDTATEVITEEVNYIEKATENAQQIDKPEINMEIHTEKRGRGRPRLSSVNSLTRSLSTSPKLNNSEIVFASKNVTTTNINVSKATTVDNGVEYNENVKIVNVEQTTVSTPVQTLKDEIEIEQGESTGAVENDIIDTDFIKDEAPKGGIEDLLKAILQDD